VDVRPRKEYDARRHSAFGNETNLPAEERREALHDVGAETFRLAA
jgi:hypothetical protein